ncbi:MAG: hypothetical protein K5864_07200, partial [Bacteroidales bacterium]|nr:hypothetical protein [Bacteroidales bacterium]
LSLVSTVSMSFRFPLFQLPLSRGESGCKSTTIFRSGQIFFRKKCDRKGETAVRHGVKQQKKFTVISNDE